jgi:hypothetical protein
VPALAVGDEILEGAAAADDAAPEGGGLGVGRLLPQFPDAGKAIEEPAGGDAFERVVDGDRRNMVTTLPGAGAATCQFDGATAGGAHRGGEVSRA